MYSPKDFDNLPWNPLKIKKNVEEQWRPFQAYKEFQQSLRGMDKDLFLNMMCLSYHKDSLLVQDYDNINDRIHKSLSLLGVEHKNGEYKKDILEVIEHRNRAADMMIIRFCSLQNNQRYTLLVTLSISYDKLMKQIYDETIDGGMEKAEMLGKMNKTANELLKSIDQLKKEVFVNDKEIASAADEEMLSYARIPGYPELVAHAKIQIN